MIVTESIQAHRIRVQGNVQGVGFRPYVYREAIKHKANGWVRNTAFGAEIMISGTMEQVTAFEKALSQNAPHPIRITNTHIDVIGNAEPFHEFSIIDSDPSGPMQAVISPDLATCPDCLAEVRDPQNRRYRYPFTNCTACGPRYSITHNLPYDRDHTTMRTFAQCPACRSEYDNPSDRRFHAQPNACPVCGPQTALWDRGGRILASKHKAVVEAALHLRQGGIVAVKGLGGFHLLVDAANDQAVKLLRERKHREEKPFAVMAPDLRTAQALAQISKAEQMWLCSPAAPIVLLGKKLNGTLADSIAPDANCLGLFLPYTPLHHLLMAEVGIPLVATSGNISDEPICTDEHEALDRLGNIADYFLVHNRPIAHPIDDSVMRVVMGQPLLLRAARGFAPTTFSMRAQVGESILGVGAHMKATIALGHTGHITVSPHIGDLETVPAWQAFEKNIELIEHVYETKPSMIVCDRHPSYATTHYAARRSSPPVHVQHHHAHILAVMAEHEIDEPVLGMAWDGTGYGDDGTIWGGEFLRVDRAGYHRVAHLRTFPLAGGDAAARAPWRSALGILYESGLTAELNIPATSLQLARQAIQRNINTTMTSSAGRLFDAVSALLGLCLHSTYEGQAAMRLQSEAEKHAHTGESYPFDFKGDILDWEPVIAGLIADQHTGCDRGAIAARFHQSMVNMMLVVAEQHRDLPIVIAGGCFQNAWLLERLVISLQAEGRRVYWPHRLPPNDGAISVGQVMHGIFTAGSQPETRNGDT